MRPVLVVRPNEFRQHRPQVLLVQHDDVVEALSAKRPDYSLHDSIRTRRSNGCGDGIDTDPSGPVAEVVTVHGQQTPIVVV